MKNINATDYRLISLGPSAARSSLYAKIDDDIYPIELWAMCKLYGGSESEAQVCGIVMYKNKMCICEEIPGFVGYESYVKD